MAVPRIADWARVDIVEDGKLRTLAVEDRVPAASPKTERDPVKSGDPRPLIVIDPGHGGIDNGTRAASGEVEKTIVLVPSGWRDDRKTLMKWIDRSLEFAQALPPKEPKARKKK